MFLFSLCIKVEKHVSPHTFLLLCVIYLCLRGQLIFTFILEKYHLYLCFTFGFQCNLNWIYPSSFHPNSLLCESFPLYCTWKKSGIFATYIICRLCVYIMHVYNLFGIFHVRRKVYMKDSIFTF